MSTVGVEGGGYYSSSIRYYLCIQHSTRARERGGDRRQTWRGGDLIDTLDGRTDGHLNANQEALLDSILQLLLLLHRTS